MADAFQIVMLTCLGFVAFVGTIMNSMTMYVLMRNKTLRKKLSNVRWYMFGQSLSETLLCAIAAPTMFANLLVGMATPFTTVPFICHSAELVGFGAGYVSFWYQTIIALTRLASVVAPHWYRHYVKNRMVTVVLCLFPWLIGYIGYVVGALAHAYHIHPTPGSGTCVANAYDDSPEAAKWFASYVLIDMILHSWSSMLISLTCYTIIYTKKWWSKWNSKKDGHIHPMAMTVAAPPVTSKQSEADVAQDGSITVPGPLSAFQPNTMSVWDPAVAKTTRKTEIERDQKIRLLAIACIANIVLISPNTIPWGLNYYAELAENAPVFAQVTEVMVYLAYPINPLLYLTVSKDFRQAFREMFRKCV